MIIVDSNIVFSTLLTSNSRFLSILMDDNIKFIAPYFLFVEIFKHKEKIVKLTKVDEDVLLKILDAILSRIQFIPISCLSKSSRQQAYDLCKDIDVKDSIFVALTIEYGGMLWTGDKKLITGLKRKGFDNFYIPQG